MLGISYFVGKATEHIPFAWWGIMPSFYRFAVSAAIVGALCVAGHELRKSSDET